MFKITRTQALLALAAIRVHQVNASCGMWEASMMASSTGPCILVLCTGIWDESAANYAVRDYCTGGPTTYDGACGSCDMFMGSPGCCARDNPLSCLQEYVNNGTTCPHNVSPASSSADVDYSSSTVTPTGSPTATIVDAVTSSTHSTTPMFTPAGESGVATQVSGSGVEMASGGFLVAFLATWIGHLY